MEGMAKSAPQADSAPVISSARNPTQSIPMSYDGVPIDILEYFDVGIKEMTQRTKTQLEGIYSYLKDDFNNMGDLLYEIRQVERKLGPAPLSDTRYGRIFNWLKVSNRIKGLEKERQTLVNG